MSAENVRNIMGFASHGVPVTVLSMAMGGASAPTTLLGELLVINAEVIGYIAAIQALFPDAPVLYGSVSSVLDVRSGLLALSVPESGLIHAGCAAMARLYGLRSMCAGFRTDAQALDGQAAFEKVVTVLPVLQEGADIIYGVAATDSGGTASFIQAVMDDEMADGLRQMRWIPQLTHPRSSGGARSSGGDRPLGAGMDAPPPPDIRERAMAEVARVLATHEPEPLDEAAQELGS
jgi:trimethylamine--corrinoid protein Co-methyltransferase